PVFDQTPASAAELKLAKQMITASMAARTLVFIMANSLNLSEVKWRSAKIATGVESYLPTDSSDAVTSEDGTSVRLRLRDSYQAPAARGDLERKFLPKASNLSPARQSQRSPTCRLSSGQNSTFIAPCAGRSPDATRA